MATLSSTLACVTGHRHPSFQELCTNKVILTARSSSARPQVDAPLTTYPLQCSPAHNAPSLLSMTQTSPAPFAPKHSQRALLEHTPYTQPLSRCSLYLLTLAETWFLSWGHSPVQSSPEEAAHSLPPPPPQHPHP